MALVQRIMSRIQNPAINRSAVQKTPVTPYYCQYSNTCVTLTVFTVVYKTDIMALIIKIFPFLICIFFSKSAS